MSSETAYSSNNMYKSFQYMCSKKRYLTNWKYSMKLWALDFMQALHVCVSFKFCLLSALVNWILMNT